MIKELKNSEKIKSMKKYATKDNLLIIILVGILLFIIVLPEKKSKSQEEEIFSTVFEGGENSEQQINTEPYTDLRRSYSETYSRDLEKRLEEILSKVDGVGEVKVMVTLAATEEVVIEKNENVNESVTKETDSNGGVREIRQTQRNETTVNESNGSAETPLVRKTFFPDLEGVLVVAEGCGNGVLDKKITEMVQAVTGLDIHRIIVAKMR